MEYIAHIREDNGIKTEQTVEAHSRETAKLAVEFAQKIGIPHIAELQGILHDAGKLCSDFTGYIRGENKIRRGEIDHSYAGARYLKELGDEMREQQGNKKIAHIARLIARTIISHHGLHDWLDEDGNNYFLKRVKTAERYDEIHDALLSLVSKEELTALLQSATEEYTTIAGKLNDLTKQMPEETTTICKHFYMGMLERLMQSILMDADRTDTADFMSDYPQRTTANPETVWGEMKCNMDKKCREFAQKTDRISKQRTDISNRCAAFANHPVGACRLIVPTGGGKTYASLRFAIEYCQQHQMERIFYIAPFMSILEQNSDNIREIAGSDNFLEHHSNVIQKLKDDETYAEELSKYELCTERWNVPVIATTLVQFLNTLFSGKSNSVRRMHRLSKAVIIIDEVQAIPAKCVNLLNLAINFLTHICGSSVVLCSATQPCLDKTEYPLLLDEKRGMTGDVTADFEAFRRTKLLSALRTTGYTYEQASDFCCERYLESGSLLVVVNTKKAALELYHRMKIMNETAWGKEATVLHISTNMCPEHRRQTIRKMRQLLAEGKKLICVTTQLIEAGVDISFRCVVRSLAGLDHAAQAAGRCNRNGEYDCSNVYLIDIVDENLSRLTEIKQEQSVAERVIRMDNTTDLLDLQAMTKYFKMLYKEQKDELSYPVRDWVYDTTLVNLLSTNQKCRDLQKAKGCHLQAFQTAGEKFQVISQKTMDVIVPFQEEAKRLILDLNSELQPEEIRKKLRQVQKYVVGIYPNVRAELEQAGALYQISCGDSAHGDAYVYAIALKEEFYSNEYGINLDGENDTFLLA